MMVRGKLGNLPEEVVLMEINEPCHQCLKTSLFKI